jgi:hypothetical protein
MATLDHEGRRIEAVIAFVGTPSEQALQLLAAVAECSLQEEGDVLQATLPAPLAPTEGYELLVTIRAVDGFLELDRDARAAMFVGLDGLACFGGSLGLKIACDEVLEDDVPALLVPPGESADAVLRGMCHAIVDRHRDALTEDDEGEDVGGYRFRFPPWWGEPTRVDQGPVLGFDSYATPDLGLLVRVMVDAAKADAATAYVEATRERWEAETRRPSEVAIGGLRFVGESAYGCADAHSVETLAAEVGTDLVAFHLVYVDKNPRHAQLRRLVIAIVEAALVSKWG